VFFFGGIFVKKIKSFFKGIKKEAKAVRWSDGKTLLKYSCITILMLVFIGLFFYGLDALFAVIRGLF
jgi:preprotein translocase SecE subunit